MSLILIAYLIFLLLFGAYSAAAIYHLNRFGFVGDFTRPATIIYIVVSAAIIGLSIFLMFYFNIFGF